MQGQKLILGLGNFGPRFERTRHNVGFLVVTQLAKTCGAASFEARGLADVTATPDGVMLMRPRLFMNENGRALAKLKGVEDICVVHDELELPLGRVRLKRGGSAKGHNGVKSVAQTLQTLEFARVLVGIGRPASRDSAHVSAHVLGSFTPSDSDALQQGIDAAVQLLVREWMAQSPPQ
jgi:PTH1 family peptidyl-tRNA hydrolase